MDEEIFCDKAIDSFNNFYASLKREYPVDLQLGKRFGKRVSYLAGALPQDNYFLPPLIFNLPFNMVLSLFGIGKVSMDKKDDILIKIELWKKELKTLSKKS